MSKKIRKKRKIGLFQRYQEVLAARRCGSISSSFVERSLDFLPTSDHYLNLGVLPELNSASLATFSFWARYGLNGWPSTQVWIGNNQTNSRQFTIEAEAKGSVGSMRIAFGSSLTTLSSIHVPDATFDGQWFHHIVVSFNSGSILCVVDGKQQTLQNQTGTFPIAIPSASTAVLIGAQNAASPNNKFQGQLLNFAIWGGWAANLSQSRILWNYNEPKDYRKFSGIPIPDYYFPMNNNSAEEIIKNWPVSGIYSSIAKFPTDRFYEDEVFEHRFVINDGLEPWLSPSVDKGNYTASPSIMQLSGGNFIVSYSRGLDHANNHFGFYGYSREGKTFPISERSWPEDPNGYVMNLFPTGTINNGSTRSFTLSKIVSGGVGGVDRLYVVINETDLPTVTGSDGRNRYVWIYYSDTAGTTWSNPVQLSGSGTQWNSVGRARVVQRKNDGSLIFGYYYKNQNENRYISSVARSTDSGSSWNHWVTIVSESNPNGTAFEEPYFGYIEDQLICTIRVDTGSVGIGNLKILRTVSNDHGQTWSSASVVSEGYQHPIWIYRESDDLMVMVNRFVGNGADITLGYPVVKISRDKGITWTTGYKLPTIFNARAMQGDFWLTDDDKIGYIWAQDHDDLARTRVWAGIFRDCFLNFLG